LLFTGKPCVGDKLHGVSSPTKWTGYALAASY